MIKARFNANNFNNLGLVKEQVEQAIFGANVDLYNALVDSEGPFFTPIDFRVASASWFMQVDGSPATHPNQPEPKKPATPAGPDLDLAAKGVGRVFSVRNNIAYIGKLEEGHSKQNQGFVAGAANAYEDFLQARVAQVKGTGGS